MSKIKQVVQAIKRGEEVTIEIKLEFDERHLLLVAGIVTVALFNLMVF